MPQSCKLEIHKFGGHSTGNIVTRARKISIMSIMLDMLQSVDSPSERWLMIKPERREEGAGGPVPRGMTATGGGDQIGSPVDCILASWILSKQPKIHPAVPSPPMTRTLRSGTSANKLSASSGFSLGNSTTCIKKITLSLVQQDVLVELCLVLSVHVSLTVMVNTANHHPSSPSLRKEECCSRLLLLDGLLLLTP